MNKPSGNSSSRILPKEEYVEQIYLFKGLLARLTAAEPIQELLGYLREEILATTKLPHAIDFLLAELNHVGTMASAMAKLEHYFTPFQTYLVSEAENDRGRFDMQLAFLILEKEALLRSQNVSPVTMFLFQFESICRNRLNYDLGLTAMSRDPICDATWASWILDIRHKIGIVDIADLVYVHSEFYQQRQEQHPDGLDSGGPCLFGAKEGRIALANRSKDNLHFFAALQRQLAYPAAPKPIRKDPNVDILPKLKRVVERLEVRIKLLEDEQRDKGIDLSQFYDKN